MRGPAPCAPALLHNMSVPPRTQIRSVQHAVGACPTVFSLAHACLACGLIDGTGADPRDWPALARRMPKVWAHSDTDLLRDLALAGVTPESADRRAAGWSGFLVGWSPWCVKASQGRAMPLWELPGAGICPDLELTAAVLARTVADLVIPRRIPDYRWPTLSRQPLCVVDTRFSAPGPDEPPWQTAAPVPVEGDQP